MKLGMIYFQKECYDTLTAIYIFLFVKKGESSGATSLSDFTSQLLHYKKSVFFYAIFTHTFHTFHAKWL
jgi:hypothetical protein